MKRSFDQANGNAFMEIFKYYKCNNPKPSLENVISPENDNIIKKEFIKVCNQGNVVEDMRTDFLGLKPVKDWITYKFGKHPGLRLIKNPFTSMGQRYWIRKCLESYPRKPNKTNVDIETVLSDWWKECFLKGECDVKLQKKLRWTTLGYHHNWDTKIYMEDDKSLFPEELAELCDCVAEYLGYKDFKAEAAIVNYYHLGSTLSAHTDHSEINLGAPLFSFSFGQSAIFLIGGNEKSIEPSAIMLESGDIAVMSQEARLSYHAVPKIVSTSLEPWSCAEAIEKINDITINFKYVNDKELLLSDMKRNVDDKNWRLFENYVKESRINMNVRQVLYDNQKSLHDVKFIK